MDWLYCDIHGVRFEASAGCPACRDEDIELQSALERERAAKELLKIQRQRAAEEGVCDCCGQRFVERTRVRQPQNMKWTGVLARYVKVGVCPACANRYGAF
jgi:hypothetical protein